MPSDYQAITVYNEEQLGKDTASRKTQVSMYSDSTHFVYELLQNADDYDATEISFKLSENNLVIEHNGEPFREQHVKAISYFGKSTSRDDLVKTGRFGIGFKSVFALTATPIIISGEEHFEIFGLYRLREHPYPDGFSRHQTRIVLPFNHESEQPDFVEELVSPEKAYEQISRCLTTLSMDTLLFTRNIREIRWEIGERTWHYLREDDRDDNARLTTIMDEARVNRYLVFSKIPEWENQKHKAVEIAFAVDEQGHLSPIDKDTLYVLFPTEEKTGLRFILNGPYRTNPARETISKTDDFNVHLMEVTCELMKELLPKLRERGFLTPQFLSVLPNATDQLTHRHNWEESSRHKLRGFYTPLHDTIVGQFRHEKLTPTRQGGHAAASGLYQDRSTRGLSELISDEDLATLLGKDPSSSLWVAKPQLVQRRDERGRFIQDEDAQGQHERIGNFLATLEISPWETENLIQRLGTQSDTVMEWLNGKSDEWHQELYVLLGEYLSSAPSYPLYLSEERKRKLSNLRIVRCSDGAYRIGRECFFPSDDVEYDERFPRVAKGVYSSGRNEDQNQKARDFLEKIKVRQVDEAVEIGAILQQRYAQEPINIREEVHTRDLNRFIAFVEADTDKADLFEDYFIFKLGDGGWGKPADVFVDSPYLDTDLSVYHEEAKINQEKLTRNAIDAFGIETRSGNNQNAIVALKAKVEEISSNYPFRKPLSPKYEAFFGSAPEKLGRFAEAVGAQATLDPRERPILLEHPEYQNLVENMPPPHHAADSRNEDYIILEFKTLLEGPSIDKSRLIWRTMCVQPESCLRAQYWTRKGLANQSYPAKSTLVHDLRSAEWVPQKDGDAIFFVQPCDASCEHLPEKGFPWQGHPHDAGEKWLEAIEFGKAARAQKAENIHRDQQAKNLGFDSSEEAKKHAELASRLKEQGISIDNVISQYRPLNSETPDFPERSVIDRARRARRVRERFSEATPIAYEPRERNIRTSQDSINQKTSLIEWYTNESGEMLCQICQQEMPFKKHDGNYYFEAVEVLDVKFLSQHLSEHHVPKELDAQYLALCPTCAAMYKYFVKGSPETLDALTNQWMNSDNLETPVQLGERETSIRFVEAHLHDLKVILAEYNSEDSTD